MKLLSTQRQKLLQATAALSTRDRNALGMLGAFLGLLIVIYGILLPSYHYYSYNKQRLNDNRELLHWIQANGDRAQQSTPAINQSRGSSTLMTAVSGSAKEFQLKLDRIQPENQTLRVWINQAKFADVLPWLQKLAAQHQINAEQISMDQGQQPGTVKLQATFR